MTCKKNLFFPSNRVSDFNHQIQNSSPPLPSPKKKKFYGCIFQIAIIVNRTAKKENGRKKKFI